MRKLSEIEGEKAVDVLAAAMSPASAIFSDPEVKKQFQAEGHTLAENAAYVLKTHKKDVVKILAIIDGKSSKEYLSSVNVITLMHDAVELFTDPELVSLFSQQGQDDTETHSGSATETTEDDEK